MESHRLSIPPLSLLLTPRQSLLLQNSRHGYKVFLRYITQWTIQNAQGEAVERSDEHGKYSILNCFIKPGQCLTVCTNILILLPQI